MKLQRGMMVIPSARDLSGTPRPFLVLRSSLFIEHDLVALLAFTTTIIDAAPLRITVQPDATNGLRLPSQAMIDHLQAMRVQRIGAIIGRIAPADMQAIDRAVAVYLGFADMPRRASAA